MPVARKGLRRGLRRAAHPKDLPSSVMRITPAGAGAKSCKGYKDARQRLSLRRRSLSHARRHSQCAESQNFARFPDRIPDLAGCAILLSAMKLLFGIAVLVLLVLSVLADYKWKQWVAARKRERDADPDRRA